MPQFHYKASTLSGEIIEGEVEARDQSAAIERLQGEGLIPIRVNPAQMPAPPKVGLFQSGRIDQHQVGALTRELSTLLRSGLPLDRAMEILIGLAQNPQAKEMLLGLRNDVRGGAALSKAMEKYPRVFSNFYLGMVRAGEASGALGAVLERISEFMERSKELKETVKSALIYPTILILVAISSVVLLLIFVVPQFSQMFEQSGKALPIPTQIVIAAGNLLRAYWWTIPAAAYLSYRYFRWQMNIPARRRLWDRRLLKTVLVGDLVTKVEIARFSRTLSTLLSNGIPLLSAMSIVAGTVKNSIVADALQQAREQLKAGQGLSKPLLSQGIFPPLAIHMIGVGEETGRLDEMLERIANVYDREVSLAVRKMLALLEPLMILGLGLVIGGIIVSILLAILKVNSLVG